MLSLCRQTDGQTDGQSDGQPDGRTDRRTTVKQYAPDLSIRGHKNRIEYNNTIQFVHSKLRPLAHYILHVTSFRECLITSSREYRLASQPAISLYDLSLYSPHCPNSEQVFELSNFLNR